MRAGIALLFDVSSAYVGEEERWWFEVLGTRGSARLAPLRVVKELNGRADRRLTQRGGEPGERVHSVVSRRARALRRVVAGETAFDAPSDQVDLHKIVEAIYKAADEGKEFRF